MNSTNNEQKKAETYEPAHDQLYQQSRKAMQILRDAGFQARLAGGCVRDRLLKRKPKDFDIATDAIPDEVCTVFKQKNMKVVPTGLDHGTITLVMGGQPIEITTLRRDVSTDGRRAVVAFSKSFEEDAARRDLTINALFEDSDGRIYDYVGGQEDLAARRLRFVGDARTRMKEDYLRILRLFRFWARYNFQPDPGLWHDIPQEAAGLRVISQERKTSELLQILEADTVEAALEAMAKTKVLPEILPLEKIPEGSGLDALRLANPKDQAVARLAALLKDRTDAREQLQKLRLSTQQIETVMICIQAAIPAPDAADSVLMDQIDLWEAKAGEGSGEKIFAPYWEHLGLLNSHTKKRLDAAASNPRRRARLPLDGAIVMEKLGLAPGPVLGRITLELKKSYRDGLWTTADEGLAVARKILSTEPPGV